MLTSRTAQIRDAWRRYVLLDDGYDDRAFRAEAGKTTLTATLTIIIGVMAAAILWWPTDWLLYGNDPEIIQAFIVFRLALLIGGCVFLAIAKFTPLARQHPVAFAGAVCVYGPLAVAIPMSTIGGPDSYWFHSIHAFPIATLIVQTSIGPRLLILLLAGLAGPVLWTLGDPAYLHSEGLGTLAGLYLFGSVAALVIGHLIYWLSRSRFQQTEALAAALAVDRGRLREMLAFQDRVLAAERARLSHDLHDVIGQSLTVLRLQLDGIRLQNGREETGLWPRINAQLDQIFRELRSVISAQRQQFEHPDVLVDSIQQLGRGIAREAGLSIRIQLKDCPLVYDRAIAAFEICREALTNCVRHAQARSVRIEGRPSGRGYLLTIRDDGVGLPADVRPGTGTESMRERAASAGAAWSIENNAGQPGACVRVWFPHDQASGVQHD
ncbi:MAG: hypothetical protein D6761_05190 [Candidatus Dadabacteria bacterium]|nr:MAG: hypothetical protein D6761_05190 [Candidatus Dadabacteria bacterium]